MRQGMGKQLSKKEDMMIPGLEIGVALFAMNTILLHGLLAESVVLEKTGRQETVVQVAVQAAMSIVTHGLMIGLV